MLVEPKKRKAERKAEGKSEVPTEGVRTEYVKRAQKTPGAVVGWEHYNSSKKGTPGLLVRFVLLEGQDAGKAAERTFWKTAAAIAQFSDFALAIGYEEPFDPDNDDHLEAMFAKGVVGLDIKEETYTKRNGDEATAARPEWFYVVPGKGKKEWNKLVEAGQKDWERYVAWRANNPRPEPGTGGGGGGGGGNSGGGGGGYGGGADPDDEIPF